MDNVFLQKGLVHLLNKERNEVARQLGRLGALKKLCDRAMQSDATPNDLLVAYIEGGTQIKPLVNIFWKDRKGPRPESGVEGDLVAAKVAVLTERQKIFADVSKAVDSLGGWRVLQAHCEAGRVALWRDLPPARIYVRTTRTGADSEGRPQTADEMLFAWNVCAAACSRKHTAV